VYLKSVSMRGFKSFAAPTTLRFEPGITCVVGPNGAGKSNVVDAIAWVLGEQGAKALRGGHMSDVIFAGTAARPALGRAEVVLTIDNSDGALPIDYTEVSISRLLYRNGESEYAVNGSPCRLLDVQELLSDTGIGRELHVVVGQGQLDAILAARPEDRRAFIEEAAGVLKHRKRKEKALRKLEAMAVNLARVSDLTAELRRQLGPLGRQAEMARKAGQIQAGLRDARLRLLADDLQGLTVALARDEADEAAVAARRAQADAALAAARSGEAGLEEQAAQASPALSRAQETWFRLAGITERARGLASLAAERRRHLEAVEPEGQMSADPQAWEAEAAAVRGREHDLAATLTGDREALAGAEAGRGELEDTLATEERELLAAARAAADRREGLARLAGEVTALRSRAAAAEEELARHAAAFADAERSAVAAAEQLAAMRERAGGLDAGEAPLTQAYDEATDALARADEAHAAARGEAQAAEQDLAACRARSDALRLALTRRDGAASLLAAGAPGVLGSVASLLEIRPGAETALAAALGPLAEALAVSSSGDAVRALQILHRRDEGRVDLLVADPGPGAGPRDSAAGPPTAGLPPGAVAAADFVGAPASLRPAVARALAGVVVVADLAVATASLAVRPDLIAVTRDGDVLGRDRASGGGRGPSLLELTAEADDAAARVSSAESRAGRASAGVASGAQVVAAAAAVVEAALAHLNDSDARMAALSEELGRAAAHERSAREEVARLDLARAAAGEARDAALAGIASREARLAAARSAPEAAERSPQRRGQLASELAVARDRELEARLAVRSGEERLRALAGRADELTRAAAAERAERVGQSERRERRRAGAALAGAVADAAFDLVAAAAADLEAAGALRDAVSTAATVREGELLAIRTRIRELGEVVDGLRDVAARDEVARTELRLRVEALHGRAAEEFGVAPQELLSGYGPSVPIPPEDAETGSETRYERVEQERRGAAAERQLALLGKVNPLALEEFAALEERHAFLAAQVQDLTRSRRDLLGIVREVDDRISESFRQAFEDTAREFATVFATLFPGGEGSLYLTDPEDLLTTGIEVTARPAGKKVSRLSLLSGGERSLAAIALLVAIFRARPSPFYVLDEVEAALDDRNLSRLLDCLEGLRLSSQLIVVTHQKRTMEIADALYGVGMRGGVSTVISQRLREPATA
jgi:chromosome segregation protein